MTLLLIKYYFQEYRNGQPFIFPFHIFLLPVTILFRSNRKQRRKYDSSLLNQERQTSRDKLFNELCGRYNKSQNNSSYGTGSSYNDEYSYSKRRDTTFAEAVAIQRHNSFMAEARQYKPGPRSGSDNDFILDELVDDNELADDSPNS